MMCSSLWRRATTALGLGVSHFSETFELDDVTSGYPSATGKVEITEGLGLNVKASPNVECVLEMGDLLCTSKHKCLLVTPNRSIAIFRRSSSSSRRLHSR